jgi:hypothetical protein
MTERRTELAHAAAADHPELTIIDGTDLLVRPEWLPAVPIPLEEITLEWQPDAPYEGLTGREPVTEHVRPFRGPAGRYDTYAETIGDLVKPPIFENRTLYRLLDANLRESQSLAFGRGSYFDTLNVGEAAGHEFAEQGAGPLRKAIGDPTDTSRRCVGVAITTLTIRLDRRAGDATFLLHWRDPGKVVHAGGLYQVVPVGVFQPASDTPGNESNDFDLWRNMVREFNEELLGASEDYGDEPIDYEAMRLYAQLATARRAGLARAYVLGLGVDPLTFATDLLTAVVIDAPIFDEVFGAAVATNAEGEVVLGNTLTESAVDRFVQKEPMQAAGAATLRLAWHHRVGQTD